MVDFFPGVIAIANLFLALVAGAIATTMFRNVGKQHPERKPWIYLLIALIVFAVLQVVSTLRFFSIYETPWMTHVLTSAIMLLLIGALSTKLWVIYK